MTMPVALIIVVIVLIILLLVFGLKIVSQYERGIVFRLGRLRPIAQPGLHFVVPLFERMERVDTRVVTLTIPPQEVITEDNVPARVNAVVLFNVIDPVKAVMEVENYAIATSQIAQTTLRSVLGRVDLDTVLAHRSALNADLRDIIEAQTQPWGVEVSVVEIKDVEIPEQMQRAMARGAEAERERRAKVINAHGELQASEELRQAADTLSKSPASLQLRYLQTLLELGADQNSTVVFPLPMDLIGPLVKRFVGSDDAEDASAQGDEPSADQRDAVAEAERLSQPSAPADLRSVREAVEAAASETSLPDEERPAF
ncbi:slipin family protein [Actinomyces radicidentis]|uniref:slipin family protein n=1 Tax=Actinomyces radicidentis TaxID=111015 RepID=UPI000A01BE65|nr:slipin family protein [Actinomyces radicidentis]